MASQPHITITVLDQWIEDSYTESPVVHMLYVIGDKLFLINKSIDEIN